MKKLWEFVKKHKKAIIIIAILIVVGFGAFKIVQAVKNAKNLLAGMQNSASTEVIERRDIVNSVTATGTIVAVDKRTVSSTVTGVKVKQLNVKVGDQVQAGDILCLLDGENLEEQLADAQKMLSADAGRSSLDVSSSNRGLNEAITTRDISAVRGEEDKNRAYDNVQDAANDCQEAKDKYDAAVNDTQKLKAKMDDAKAVLASAYSSREKTEKEKQDISNAMGEKSTEFGIMLTQMDSYVSSINAKYPQIDDGVNPIVPGEDINVNHLWKSGINGVDSDLYSLTLTNVYIGDNPDIQNTISMYINNLNSIQTEYDSLSKTLNSPVVVDNTAVAEAAYQQAKAAYEAALAQEESRKSMYESAAKTVESMWDSYNNVLRNIDDSKRSNDSAVASRVDSVKNSQLSASTATLSDKRTINQLQEQIDGCVVSASIGGIVTDVAVVEGDNYMGGAIITIENTTDYEVSAQIDEYDIAKVEVGQEVIVKTNGTGSLEMKGQVKSIAPHATTSVGTSGVKYEVLISILERNDDIRLDMTAKVEIISDKRESVLSVSTEAIQEDDDGNYYVEVFDGGLIIDTSAMLTDPESVDEEDLEKMQNGENSYESHKVSITKGLEGDYYTEISGEGLEEGTEIVVPNEGAMSELEEYMNQAGMIGGF